MVRSSSDFFDSSSIQSSNRENRGFSIFYVNTRARDERANWGRANMRVVRGSHFRQLGSITSLATETRCGEILVAFWPKHGLRSARSQSA